MTKNPFLGDGFFVGLKKVKKIKFDKKIHF